MQGEGFWNEITGKIIGILDKRNKTKGRRGKEKKRGLDTSIFYADRYTFTDSLSAPPQSVWIKPYIITC